MLGLALPLCPKLPLSSSGSPGNSLWFVVIACQPPTSFLRFNVAKFEHVAGIKKNVQLTSFALLHNHYATAR